MTPTISDLVAEVDNIAATLEDSPFFLGGGMAADGIVAMQQAAQAFRNATTDAARLDACLWLADGYQQFSNGLPDTGYTELQTGWNTALQISNLLGGTSAWETRCRQEYGR